MASDTPLTDAVLEQARTWETVTDLTDHARQMERDRNNLLNQREMLLDALRDLYEHCPHAWSACREKAAAALKAVEGEW
jgi:hypothetical protein